MAARRRKPPSAPPPSAPPPFDNLDLTADLTNLIDKATKLLGALAAFDGWAEGYLRQRVTYAGATMSEAMLGVSLWVSAASAAVEVEQELHLLGFRPDNEPAHLPGRTWLAAWALKGWLCVMRRGETDGWGMRSTGLWARDFVKLDAEQIGLQLCRLRSIVANLTQPSETVPPRSESGSIRFSSDYRSCVWGKTTYSFTTMQASVVGLLAEARARGTPDLAKETLLEEAGSARTSQDARLRDVFRGNPALGQMIVRGERKGTYRLADPPA
jgi:hypothetical protein